MSINTRGYSFFFFKQKTAYEMRISDWSSDVCSSDLTSQSATAALSSSRVEARSCADSATSNNSAMRASTCGINWRVTMTRGRLGRVESGMAADRARRGAAVKSRAYEKAGDERSLLRGERLKCGDEFEKAKR